VVLFVTLAAILHGTPDWLPAYSLGLIAGISSGAAMIPYVVIKEVNRPEHSGTATGVISFLNFSLSAILGPLFGIILARASNGGPRDLDDYQTAFDALLYIVALAAILTFFLRETGLKRPSPARQHEPRHQARNGLPRAP
jgi:MFS family permease